LVVRAGRLERHYGVALEGSTNMVARAQLLRAMVLQGGTMVVRACQLGERLRIS
jgi:hypothetical protein